MKDFQKILKGGDFRTIGKSNSIVSFVNTQAEFDKLFRLLFSADRLVVMRAADAIEKITVKNPALISKHKKEILQLADNAINKELKWHIALLLPRLPLTKHEQQKIWRQLRTWLCDKEESKIVRVNSLQALHEIKNKYNIPDSRLLKVNDKLKDENSPSIIARLRKLQAHNHQKA